LDYFQSGEAMTETARTPIVSLEDMQAADSEALIDAVLELDCHELSSVYWNKLSKIDRQNQESRWTALSLIHELCRMHFKPSDRAEPFGPIPRTMVERDTL
jgi:hypothetical protein